MSTTWSEMTAPADVADVVQGLGATATVLALACALFLITLVYLWVTRPSGNVVLLLGPCDAGKTTLFHQLRDGSTYNGAVASMSENDAEFVLLTDKGRGPRPVRVVDVPGHPRVRRNFERYISTARGIVFVVDSVDFMPHKMDTAEQLNDVLSHPALSHRRIPVLLACNKADAGVQAHSVDFIRKRLEKEIEALRGSRGTLSDGTKAESAARLTSSGEAFTFGGFAQMTGCRVRAVAVSALDRGGVKDVESFLRQCVPA